MDAWDVYFVMQADMWVGAAVVFATCSGSFAIAAAIHCIVSNFSDKAAVKVMKCALVCCAPCTIAALLMPTTKTMAAMYVLPKLANNQQLQQDAGDVYELAIQAIKEQLQTTKRGEEE